MWVMVTPCTPLHDYKGGGGGVTIYWDTPLLINKIVKLNKNSIMIWNATEQTAQIIDVTVPQYYNVVSATANKITKYKDLQIKIQKFWSLKKLLLCRLWLVHWGLHVAALRRTWQISPIMCQKEYYRRLHCWVQHIFYRIYYLRFNYRHTKYNMMDLALNCLPTHL